MKGRGGVRKKVKLPAQENKACFFKGRKEQSFSQMAVPELPQGIAHSEW